MNIPHVKEITCHDVVYSQITFYCDITNEWLDFLKSDIHLIIKNEEREITINPVLKELNHARFCPRVSDAGLYTLSVIIDNEVCFQKELRVI